MAEKYADSADEVFERYDQVTRENIVEWIKYIATCKESKQYLE